MREPQSQGIGTEEECRKGRRQEEEKFWLANCRTGQTGTAFGDFVMRDFGLMAARMLHDPWVIGGRWSCTLQILLREKEKSPFVIWKHKQSFRILLRFNGFLGEVCPPRPWRLPVVQ